MTRKRTLVTSILIFLCVLVFGGAVFWLGRFSVNRPVFPEETSVEAGFARDMQVHHNQGVELAFLIRDRTQDETIRTLAYDIATTQSQQSGQLYGWLTQWGLSQLGSEKSMTWMTKLTLNTQNHDSLTSHDSTQHGETGTAMMLKMPGLATSEQIKTLTEADSKDAEKQFLSLMIAHHKGALVMAQAILDRSDNVSVTNFARSVIASQQSEIDLMTGLLKIKTAETKP